MEVQQIPSLASVSEEEKEEIPKNVDGLNKIDNTEIPSNCQRNIIIIATTIMNSHLSFTHLFPYVGINYLFIRQLGYFK